MYAIIFHAHQKLDRVAHRHLRGLLPPGIEFPGIREVLHFEAGHGPDRAHLKQNPSGIQPWHFIDPTDEEDTDLQDQIEQHYRRLVKALKISDHVRASFEAAWMAHALVDGLTPAHHFPYESELELLRGGEPHHTRKGLAGRLYVKSDTMVETVQRSYKLVGPKGLLTSHAMFEAGAYAIIAPMRLTKARPTKAELEKVMDEGIVNVFKQVATEISDLNLYERFCENGWVRSVNRDIRKELAPRMVRTVTLAWYAAALEAGKVTV